MSRPPLPGPRMPAIATGLWFARDPIGFFTTLRRRYGDAFTVRFPWFGHVVYVSEPDLVREVFRGDPAIFHAGEANATVLEAPLGPRSVLTLDEDEHLRQRRLLLPPFHGGRVRAYGDVIREAAHADIDTWPVGTPFALRPRMEAITLAVILRAVFGITDEARFQEARRVIGEFARRSHAVMMLPGLRVSLGGRSPWDRFVRARDAVDEFIAAEIAARRAAPDAAERDDVLSMLLQATHEDGSPMSDAELRDELVTVVGAGHETTATGLAWAFERLVRHPDVLATLRRRLDDDDYVDAVCKETLRVRPVIVDVARKLTAEVEIAGARIPAGTIVLPAIAALHFREDLFPEARRFRPERFLTDDIDNLAWIPFGGGVRRCAGAAFAQYEMRLVLRAVVERTDLHPAEPEPERLSPRNITVAPANGARVVMDRPPRPRRAAAAAAAAA